MKGQLYTLEVGISIMMILSMVVFLFLNPSQSPEHTEINYKMKAYNALETLESTGDLRRHVSNNNVTAINESLALYIPSFLGRYVVIYNDTANLTTKPSLTDINDSISVSYFLSGDFDDYGPREIRVYIWGYKEVYTTSTTTTTSTTSTSTTTTTVHCVGTSTCSCSSYQTVEECMSFTGLQCEPVICCSWNVPGRCEPKNCASIANSQCTRCTGCYLG